MCRLFIRSDRHVEMWCAPAYPRSPSSLLCVVKSTVRIFSELIKRRRRMRLVSLKYRWCVLRFAGRFFFIYILQAEVTWRRRGDRKWMTRRIVERKKWYVVCLADHVWWSSPSLAVRTHTRRFCIIKTSEVWTVVYSRNAFNLSTESCD